MTGFNVDDELVRKLAVLLDDTGLTEIEYAKGEESIRVSRGTTAAPPGPGEELPSKSESLLLAGAMRFAKGACVVADHRTGRATQM